MERNLFICAGLLLFLYFAGPGLNETRDLLQGFLAGRREAITMGGLPGALGLVFLSLLFRKLGYFSVLYLLARLVNELCKLLLVALAISALIAGFAFGLNLWLEAGWLVSALYAWFYGSAFSLWLFDFNYPLKKDLLIYTILPLACLILVRVAALLLALAKP